MATGGRSNGRILIFIALILIVGLAVAAYFLRDQLFPQPVAQQQNTGTGTPQAPAVETIDVVILTQSAAMGAVITNDMVAMNAYPKDKFVPGLYFTDKTAVVGKRARYPLVPPVVLTSGLLSEAPVGGLVASQIPPGYVAISIPVESALNSVSNALSAGDHVSILVSLLLVDVDQNFQTKLPNITGDVQIPVDKVLVPKTMKVTNGATGPAIQGRTELDPIIGQPVYVLPGEANQRPRAVSQILVSDAIVLGVGDLSTESLNKGGPQPTPTPGPTPAAVPTPVPVDPAKDASHMVTLIVSPQDAVTINYILLTQGAKLNLVLRSASETNQFKTEAVTLQFLMDQYNIPLPSKLQYGLEPAVPSLNYQNYVATPAPKP